ncbi:hypothetical protein Tco_0669684 [Tanacetum coccineum]
MEVDSPGPLIRAANPIWGCYRLGIKKQVIENQVPPSPDYIPGPEVPPSPDNIPGPEPSPTCRFTRYVPIQSGDEPKEDDEDPKEDPADYPADREDDDDDDEDEDEIRKEEEAPSSGPTLLLALTTPPPSPLTPLSSPLPHIPSPPLPASPPLPIPSPPPNSPTHIEIPESCLPLQKRVHFASPTPSHEVGESLAAGAARQDGQLPARKTPYNRAIEEIAPTTLEGVNQRVTNLSTTVDNNDRDREARMARELGTIHDASDMHVQNVHVITYIRKTTDLDSQVQGSLTSKVSAQPDAPGEAGSSS